MEQRPFDVIVFGATGFAGRLVAEYLQDHHAGEIRWAVAGRNQAKLEKLVASLADRRPDAPPVEFRIADSQDHQTLEAMAAATRVVCTTVGPYAKYGGPVVAACVAKGAHYCDLTGEPQFVRRMMDAHHDEAVTKELRIVHCCGFDSIPSDLGTRLVQETAIQRDGTPCDRVEFILKGSSGGFSGGTIASLVNVLEEASDPAIRRILGDPYSLAVERGPDSREQTGVRYSEAAGVWTAPFVMAAVNERIVRRTNHLLGYRYGRDFRYGESMQTGRGTRGRLKALGMTAGLGGFTAGMMVGPVRKGLLKMLPSPGEGPSDEAIESGFFKARLFGQRDGEVVVTVDVTGTRDPGYGATACMLAEAAILLASDQQLGVTGVCTPGSAMGLALIERLHAKQVQFEVVG
jgi:short subunit dehydrogenase-like uncharacterized protein